MNRKVRHPNLSRLYEEVDQFQLKDNGAYLPRIGISANRKDGLSCIAETYVDAVLLGGGAPVLIPVITDLAALTAIVDQLDGLVMTGGADINPLYLNEEPIPQLQDVDSYRDEFDLILIRLASHRQIPIMGICRGHQILNVAFGGLLYQDMQAQSGKELIKHSQLLPRDQVSHTVSIVDRQSVLGSLYPGEEQLWVNSFHHQSVVTPAPEFIETALAPDGINEGTEHPEKQIFSIQWHPEALTAGGDEQMLKLFKLHIAHAGNYARAKAIHQTQVILDSHADTPWIFPDSFDLGKKEGGKVNLPLMEEGFVDATVMAAYLPQGDRDQSGYDKAWQYALNRLQEIRRQELLHPDRMGIAVTADDVYRLKRENKKAILLGVENGYAIGKSLEKLDEFSRLGVIYMTLCHNGNNDICDSARGEAEWNGLSPFGKTVISRMNELGMLIDLSHASEQSFYDALACSRYPVIASHSSARALCDHPRNLTDDQLKAIAARGGVVQVCLYKGFINEQEEKASVSDAIRHIDHIVSVAGIDAVGIGSDFDGDGELIGCRASNELMNITIQLLNAGYQESDIAKIWGGNFLRVMRTVQAGKV